MGEVAAVILGIIGLLLIATILGTAYYLIVFQWSYLLLGAAVIATAAFAIWRAVHPFDAVKVRYTALAARIAAQTCPSPDAFRESLMKAYVDKLQQQNFLLPIYAVCVELFLVMDELYASQGFDRQFDLPPPPQFEWKLKPNYAYEISKLEEIERHIDGLPNSIQVFSDACLDMLWRYTRALAPRSAFRTWEEFRNNREPLTTLLTSRASDALINVGSLISSIGGAFLRLDESGLFAAEAARYRANRDAISEQELSKRDLKDGKVVWASQYAAAPAEVANVYLRGTVWERAFNMPIPLAFDDEMRFQNQWVIALPGHGKTQLLSAQIAADLPRVARGEASIVVMDSQGTKPGTLIGDLIRLKVFAEGQPLAGKLVFLEPDPDYPLAFNLFDFGLDRTHGMTERQRRSYLESVTDLVEFIISGLVGAEQTPMMQGISGHLIEALTVIPGATVQTFMDLMGKDGHLLLAPHIHKFDDYNRKFFETRFSHPQYEATKAGVMWRLDSMLRKKTFREMFLATRNKLDLSGELNAGKVIVVHTDPDQLGTLGCEAFGRFILAQLLRATQQRANDPKPMPTFVYIDEAQDYIANEERLAIFIDKARKQKVGFVFSHQRLSNIKSRNVADALANTAVQFAAGNRTDAPAVADLFHTTPEFIEHQPKGSFACYRKGTPAAIQVSFPDGMLRNMDKMTAEEEAQMRQYMRDHYSETPKGRTPSLPSPPPAGDTEPPNAWG